MRKFLSAFLMLQRALYDTSTVGTISGSIGGNTYTKNGIVRKKSNPVNPNTSAQAAQRALVATLANAWRDLTEAQQNAWAAATSGYPYVNRLGKTALYTGQQLYMKLNSNLAAIGQSAIDVPGAPISVPAPVLVSAAYAIGAGTFELNFTPDPVPASTYMIIEATSTRSAGKTFQGRSEYRSIAVAAPAAASPVDLYTTWNAKYSSDTPAAGNRIFVRACLVSATTGQRSAYDVLLTTVTA